MTIRVIYHPVGGARCKPSFPATDQHPDAARFDIDHPVHGPLCVDAIGAQPSIAEIDAVLTPPPPSAAELEADALSALNGGAGRIDTLKLIKAKVLSDLAFRLGKLPGALTLAEINAERQRIANIYKAL